MRVIKLRAWLNTEKRMISSKAVKHLLFACIEEDNRLEFMLYSGFKDIKGIECYDGDIIESNNIKYKIEFLEGCFYATNNKQRLPLSNFKGIFKVIGNMYEGIS